MIFLSSSSCVEQTVFIIAINELKQCGIKQTDMCGGIKTSMCRTKNEPSRTKICPVVSYILSPVFVAVENTVKPRRQRQNVDEPTTNIPIYTIYIRIIYLSCPRLIFSLCVSVEPIQSIFRPAVGCLGALLTFGLNKYVNRKKIGSSFVFGHMKRNHRGSIETFYT